MYKIFKNGDNRKIRIRATRQHEKYIFRTDSEIGKKYSNSPFYKGCKLWDKLSKETQFLDSTTLLKKCVMPMFKPFDKIFIV